MSNSSTHLRVVFMGTPAFAADILQDLAEHEEVACVYTQPDRVRSRGNKTQASPVKEQAEALGLPVICLSNFKDGSDVERLRELAPDVICVAAFGAILPKEVLEIPRLGCINVHASILPRWRGAAPIERAVLAGDEEVGVCIMRMEEGLDTGDFCICRRMPVGDLNAGELTEELAALGSVALLSALAQLREGNARWTAQDGSLVTYADKIEKHELYLDPFESARTNALRVQASSAAHPAKCKIRNKPLTVLAAKLPKAVGDLKLEPAQARFRDGELLLGCKDGVMQVLTVKPDGKREMAARDFAQGMPALKAGAEWTAL